MYKVILIIIAVTLSFFITALFAAETFQLITQEEYQAQLGHEPASRPAYKSLMLTDPDAPKITILSPQGQHTLIPPVNIEVRFEAGQDSQINPESVKILYGWLNLDITKRIKDKATITETGIVARQVTFPAGKHNLKIQITDTRGRKAEKKFRFSVARSTAWLRLN
jgi:hypothetical protein